MKKRLLKTLLATTTLINALSPLHAFAQEQKNYELIEGFEIISDGVTKFGRIKSETSPQLTFGLDSNVDILTVEENEEIFYFKDLNGNGELDTFEDWRLASNERAKDLSSRITIDQAAGLMLFSSHEFDQSEGLTEDQKKYLKEDDVRNVLHAGPNNVEDTVQWVNAMQAYVESLATEEIPFIPVNFSSDPRNTAGDDAGYNATGDISRWPSNLGIAATFNPNTMREFSKMSSEEYRALGITMALGPQIDLATEPRWLRVDGTFGESPKLATAMTEAYVNESQSTYNESEDVGWGEDSVTMMIKHYPGDGAGESGRESHTFVGKYAAFPGDNLQEHVDVFVNGGLGLSGKTNQAGAIMLSYSIQLDKDGNPIIGDEKLPTAYNKVLVDQLREKYGYDQVLCTDWLVTNASEGVIEYSMEGMGMAYGLEDLTPEMRHYLILKSGVDMFGGNNDKAPVLEAYNLWQEAYEKGEVEDTAEDRFRTSARRILTNFFNTGLFEDPFLELEASQQVVASDDKVEAGFKAQLESIVMLKNNNDIIQPHDTNYGKDLVVYIPSTMRTTFANVFNPEDEIYAGPSLNIDVAKNYFKDVLTDIPVEDEDGKVIGYEAPDNISEADLILVGMQSPINGSPFSFAGVKEDSETYYPLSLQYRPYTADSEYVRKTSIGGDILEDGTKENRSYFGETSKIGNEYDLDAALNASELGNKYDIPVVVALSATNPTIVSEFEPFVDAIVVGFQVSHNALIEVILGHHEPKGLLPIQFPQNMETVEANQEDVPFDLTPYKDSMGNIYDFGFGLNFSGIIEDERVDNYR